MAQVTFEGAEGKSWVDEGYCGGVWGVGVLAGVLRGAVGIWGRKNSGDNFQTDRPNEEFVRNLF